MIVIDPHRREEIKSVVLSVLQHFHHASLPVKIKAICKSYPNIRLIPFSVHMKRHNLSYEEMKEYCGTSDSCADYYAKYNKYIIYYNDVDIVRFVNSNRYRWNIAHELGHILLSHHKINDKTRIYRSSLSDAEYDYFEAEADYFAQLILVPHAVLYAFKIQNEHQLKTICKISNPAAKRRFRAYQQWIWHINGHDPYDRPLFQCYYKYIYQKRCTTCNAYVIQPKGKFCPICGNKTLQWGETEMKYPVKIKVNGHSKALRCPVCDNEEISIEGTHCPICGTDLVNQCTNIDSYGNGCGALAAGNARYCIYCGSETTFLYHGLLKPWTEEINSLAFAEDYEIIRQNWEHIVQELGGLIRPCFQDTALEYNENYGLTIVFSNQNDYDIGSRPTILNEIENYIKRIYGKEISLKTCIKNENRQFPMSYIIDKELSPSIRMDITVEA